MKKLANSIERQNLMYLMRGVLSKGSEISLFPTEDSPTIVKRNAALAMMIATQRSLILLLPLLPRSSAFSVPFPRTTTLTIRDLRCFGTSKNYDRGRIVESWAILRVESILFSKAKGTRDRNVRLSSRLCATGRSGRERLRKGGSRSQIALASHTTVCTGPLPFYNLRSVTREEPSLFPFAEGSSSRRFATRPSIGRNNNDISSRELSAKSPLLACREQIRPCSINARPCYQKIPHVG